jgi:hypothetical protein
MLWTARQGLVAVLVAAAGGAIAITHGSSAHAGEHFVSGQADANAVTVKLDADRACVYDQGAGMVFVPVRLRVAAHVAAKRASVRSESFAGKGWVTLHVTATVSSRHEGERIVTSATKDFPMDVTVGDSSWVGIPLGRTSWRPGPNDCAIAKWTMTPGAWLSNDD